MPPRSHAKKDFSTRLSPQTLARLEQLIQSGRFKTRTAAIEAAIERLVAAEQEEFESKRRALDEACGMFRLGIDPESMHEAELDRLEYEGSRNTPRT